jgi:trimeric autotransporter adhesin
MLLNTSGSYKLYHANTTGNNNVALGGSALSYNTTGNYNVALGQSALNSNTTGYYNVALGTRALKENTTGNNNVALGFNVQSGDYSGSVILGAKVTATANGQLALGSSYHPIGPVASEALVSNKTLQINLNGNLYKILMYQA